jgi:1-acyl-sn-glycerol-3-phosphate acyltransferase
MLGTTIAALAFAPIIVAGAAAADLALGRRTLPRVRIFLFLLQYGINDSIEILASPVLWMVAGFGRRLHEPASIARHQRLQRWSLRVLRNRAEALLGLRVELSEEARSALTPAPFIIVCRHVSLFDASLPSVVLLSSGFHVRGVIMAELLADPGFDLLYGRLGSVFIPRDNGPEARVLVAELGAGLDDHTVAVIFPEGRLFRPDVLVRTHASLQAKDPERAARLAPLRHALPPRPGGWQTLLAMAPHADVVVMNHVGLERFGRIADLVGSVPLCDPVRVNVRRVARRDIPTDAAEQARWLDDQWLDMDRWVTEQQWVN